MRTTRRLTKTILQTIAQGEHRSPLFWWMVEHHDEIAAAAGRRIRWKGVCAAAAESGLTDTRGCPPSERNARETWRQARFAVAAARQRREAELPPRPGAKYPSRISPSWRPQEVVVPPPPIPFRMPADKPSGALMPVTAGQPVGKEEFTPEQLELIAKQEAKASALFAEHDAKFKF